MTFPMANSFTFPLKGNRQMTFSKEVPCELSRYPLQLHGQAVVLGKLWAAKHIKASQS